MNRMDDFRPIPFYFLNTTRRNELSREGAAAGMQQLKSEGFGGCILFNKPPTGFNPEEYLSDYWFEVTENFILAARDQELRIWINDGMDFPPGDAGGRIEKIDPALKQRRLVKTDSGKVEVVEVDWGFPAFEEPESSRLFIELIYEEYHKRLGKYFGNGIVGFFSDADNRRINDGVTRHMNGKPFFPWPRDFSKLFDKRFGYQVEPFLPGILDGKEPSAAADYWRLAGELYQNWFKNNYAWCRSHGLKYTFHTSDTGPFTSAECLRSAVFSEGDPLALAGQCDYPGTDHELLALDGGTHFDKRCFVPSVSRGGSVERLVNPGFAVTKYDLRAKYAASAAFLYGRERVVCESFAATNWGAAPDNLRRIAAWQIMQGINFFVPHAVHHRFRGPTKYFAPPEFRHGSLRHGLRELNDWIAKYSMIATQGEYVASIAVIDPTPEIWKGGSAGQMFELCDKLARQVRGYVVTDVKHATNFPIVFDPVKDSAFDLPPADTSFDGGEIAYMRRKLPDGTEYLLASNIWSDFPLSGNLTFMGRTVNIELVPGEIAVIGGPYEEFRAPFRISRIHELPFPAAVRWESPNIVPFHSGAHWENTEPLDTLHLKVPIALKDQVVYDGSPLRNGTPAMVFDDEYVDYPLDGTPGEHRIDFSPEEYTTPIYLSGEFDVDLETAGDFHHEIFNFYNMKVFEPEISRLQLKSRSAVLMPGSWADQGALFYSGSAVYQFELEGAFRRAVVCLPETAEICEVELDDRMIGRAVWQPYMLPLGDLKGRHRLNIRVFNTSANQLAEYRAPGGLLKPPFIAYK
ncbi:MAG: glycosyl hydrolase [Kiritimatiellaeota bacterium]|nr:glycosyl hydrolase [Kiritimatiellota bacterium]